MTGYLFNYGLAFIEGFALIISPCILPILPIILAGALTGGARRALGIMVGFTLTFAIFTLFSRFLLEHLGINFDLVRQVSYGFIIGLGIILFSDTLSEKFNQYTSRIANFGAQFSGGQSDSFFAGLLLGLFTSLIWVPCGGPIIAAAIIQTAVQETTAKSFFTFFFFALGSMIPMMLIAFAGQKIIHTLGFLKSHAHQLRKFFAVIIIIGGGTALFFDTTQNYSPMPSAPNILLPNDAATSSNHLLHPLLHSYLAPSIDNNSTWFNSPPLTLSELKGKVVLIDFWTYSCINCIRTLPYLKDWYAKYQKDGLVIIGVHAPEFVFEQNPNNVQAAITQYGIQYPVVLDNHYVTWGNYHNQYWPADYLIDKNGRVVYAHFGEGDYLEAENNIRVLLGLNEMPNMTSDQGSPIYAGQTPETYLGFARADHNTQPLSANQTTLYQYPSGLPQNSWSLQGEWSVEGEKIVTTQNDAAIKIHFYSGKVYVVMGSVDQSPIPVKVLLNGQPIGQYAGKDVKNNMIVLKQHKLYEVASFKQPTDGVIELIAEKPSAEFYTFTFGN